MKRPTKDVSHLRIGVDTGGTFTDFIVIFKNQQIAFKLPSTPQAPEEAILVGLGQIFDELEVGMDAFVESMCEIVHGTTVATNTLLERKGARTALVTTAGFEDVIEIGRQARPDLYNLSVIRPAPLGVPVSISHQILPEYREYERTSTIVINAYLAPRVRRYLSELTDGLSRKLAKQSFNHR